MVTRRNHRLKDVRERIMEESIRLFSEHGFNGTSIQAIAEAVGIRKPSLLYHFGSKEQLRDEVLREMLSHWKNELPRLLSNATSGQDRFSSIISAVMEFFFEDRNRARLTVREMLDRPQEIGLLIKEHLGPWIKLIADYIRMGQESGTIRKSIDPEFYIIQVIMLVAGAVALSGVTSVIIGADREEAVPEFENLVRIARDTLFVESVVSKERGRAERSN